MESAKEKIGRYREINTKATKMPIMIIMGIFVAFVLISLYLPIFSLADSIRS